MTEEQTGETVEPSRSVYDRVLDAWEQGVRVTAMPPLVGVSYQRCQQIIKIGTKRGDPRALARPMPAKPSTSQLVNRKRLHVATAPKREAILNAYAILRSARKVAEKLGVNHSLAERYVTTSRKKHDPRTRKSGTKTAKILKLWNEGAKSPEIRKKVGASAGYVELVVENARKRGLDIPYRSKRREPPK